MMLSLSECAIMELDLLNEMARDSSIDSGAPILQGHDFVVEQGLDYPLQ
jgi:hypothetical protein